MSDEHKSSRLWFLGETALARFSASSPVRGLFSYLCRKLRRFMAQLPIEPLDESLVRAELRATAADLRALQSFLGEVAHRRKAFKLPPADRALCDWAAERARDVALIAVRIERRVGPRPKPGERSRRRKPSIPSEETPP